MGGSSLTDTNIVLTKNGTPESYAIVRNCNDKALKLKPSNEFYTLTIQDVASKVGKLIDSNPTTSAFTIMEKP